MVLRWISGVICLCLLACSDRGDVVDFGKDSVGKPDTTSEPSFLELSNSDELLSGKFLPQNYFEIDLLDPDRVIRKPEIGDFALSASDPIELGFRTLGYIPNEERYVLAEAANIIGAEHGFFRVPKGFEGRYAVEDTPEGRQELVVYLKSTIHPQKKKITFIPQEGEIIVGRAPALMLGFSENLGLVLLPDSTGIYSSKLLLSSERVVGWRASTQWYAQIGCVKSPFGKAFNSRIGACFPLSSFGELRGSVQSSIFIPHGLQMSSASLQYILPQVNKSFKAIIQISTALDLDMEMFISGRVQFSASFGGIFYVSAVLGNVYSDMRMGFEFLD